MKKIQYYFYALCIISLGINCSKSDKGFISPNVTYLTPQFIVSRGIYSTSTAVTLDGSSYPISVKPLHYYDDKGNIVDSIFQKKYAVGVWSDAYNSTLDSTYALIIAKRTTKELAPIEINETNGSLVANSGSYNLPLGTYYLSIQVSNSQGTVDIEKAMKIIINDTKPFQTTPEIGSYSCGLMNAGTATGRAAGGLFTGNNNPFVVESVTRYSDTPNNFVLKIVDKNGVVFSGAKGEFVKRPASGLNPVPPYLQNLQYYAPDTFNQPDSGTLNLKYPLVPFPIATLGNGFNMYYVIPAKYAHIDSTTTWSSNTANNFYKGTADSRFKGYFKDGLYDYALRIPMRIMVPGSYQLTIKLLDVSHITN